MAIYTAYQAPYVSNYGCLLSYEMMRDPEPRVCFDNLLFPWETDLHTSTEYTTTPVCVWDGWLLPTFLHQFETGGLNSMICFPCTHFSSRLGCCFSHLDLYPLINRRQTSIGITSADAGHQTKKNCTRIQSTNNTKSCLLLACRVFFIYVQSCLAREKNNHLRSFFEWIEYIEYLIKSSACWACVFLRWIV